MPDYAAARRQGKRKKEKEEEKRKRKDWHIGIGAANWDGASTVSEGEETVVKKTYQVSGTPSVSPSNTSRPSRPKKASLVRSDGRGR
jgi:hypothetical protein